jgi:hypothetical protein
VLTLGVVVVLNVAPELAVMRSLGALNQTGKSDGVPTAMTRAHGPCAISDRIVVVCAAARRLAAAAEGAGDQIQSAQRAVSHATFCPKKITPEKSALVYSRIGIPWGRERTMWWCQETSSSLSNSAPDVPPHQPSS